MSGETVAVVPIDAVTVLEDRASITRRGVVAVRAGQQRIAIEGVSPILADKTLFASATGARVLDVRCARSLAPWRDPAGPALELQPLDALHAERGRLEAERDDAVARTVAARNEIRALGELDAAALRDLSVAATRGSVAEAAGPLAELDAREAAARVRLVDAELDARRVSAAIDRLAEQIMRAEDQVGSEAARIEIDLVADAAGEVAILASYVVPGAAWRPYHRATLAREPAKLEWETTACVWQATGEDWRDVELACSLERPSLGVEPPSLGDDELHTRKRAESVVVEVRDQGIQTTGLGGGEAQVPGIDDGGTGLVLRATGRVTIVADGAPHRISVAKFAAPAQISLVAMPLASPWVHVRARVVNSGAGPLLAGPIDLIMASGYVGRGEIGFVAPGEKAYVGFGTESDVRVHRSETRERDEAGLLGGWNVQTVRVAVRLSNLSAQRREIVVTERIPISEVEQVDVQLGAADAYLLGDSDEPSGGDEITQVTARAIDERGLITWSVELPPNGRRAVTLEYKIKTQRGVTGV